MSQKRPEDHKVIAARLEEPQAKPAVNPPATPVKTPQKFTGLLGD